MRNIFTSALALMAWLLLLITPLTQVKAQSSPVDPQTAAQLQTRLDQLIGQYNLKGLSASVILPGKGTWNGVSGISHDSVSIDTAMVFAYGSITKNLTAAAILLLQQDSLLSLSDSLHKFLPTYANIDSTITLKQLLQHTSGIFNYFNHPDWQYAVNSNPGQAMTPQFVLSNYINAPVFAPGTSWEYSNTNYLLLGLIIEEVTGQSYSSFIRQRMLDPLQLTSVYLGEHEPATGIMPHSWTDTGIDLHNIPFTSAFGTSGAAGALVGNAYDLARWGRLLFSGQVLQDTSLQLMKQFTSMSFGLASGYGLGLQRYGSGAAQAWGHSGGIRGFASCLMFSPADSIVVSMLSNKTASTPTLTWALLYTARQLLVNATPGEAENLRDALVCFPNPVHRNGNIKYTLQQAQQVEITLQNSLGQTVQTLLSQPIQAGEHSLRVNTSTLPSGMYFCTLQTAGTRLVQRWVVTH